MTSIGSVNPVPPAVGGSFTGLWVVGDANAVDPDIRAWVSIDDGTPLQYGTLIIGDEEEYTGELNVLGDFLAGLNTRLTLSGNGTTSNPTVQVGHEGTGRLNIRGGSTMEITSSFGDMSIGVELTGVGAVTVSDPFTILTIEDELFVGDDGIGRLNVLDGAMVRTLTSNSSDFISIGTGATGVGTVVVDGTDSILRVGSNLVVGGLGLGTLTISNQAIVDADNASSPTVTVGTGGRLELAGGTLIGAATTVDGYLGGSGFVRGTVDFGDGAFLEAGTGDLLRFEGDVSNQGAITVDEGELQFLAAFTNNTLGAFDAPGRITLENGTVRLSQALTNDGVISSAHGANNIHGEITNQGTIVVASESVATFNDSVTDNGGMVTVLARGNALFLADVMFQAASTVQMSVGIENLIDNSAQIGVVGEATLAGDLIIDVDANYTPMLGETFELITATGGIVGTFDNTMVPNIPGGLEYGVLYDATHVLLEVRVEVVTILEGDYNGNGIVDAADYTVWRDTLGQAGAGLAADGDGDNMVTQLDYDVWKTNFGMTAGSGSGATGSASALATVPEPATAMLVLLGTIATLACRPFILRTR